MQSPRGLHRSEMARLVKRVEKRLLLLPPRFNLERDWKLMLELAGHQTGIGRLDSGGLTRVIDKTIHANKVKSEMPASAAAEFDPDKHSAKQPPCVLYLPLGSESTCLRCACLQLLSAGLSSSAGGSSAWAY